MADEYILQTSMDLDNDNTFDITQKRVLQVNDSNNGNYSTGEVIFDLASISNSGMYLNWKGTEVHIPIALQVRRSDAMPEATVYDSLCASLKNGNFSILHAMTLTLSNQQVINLQPHMHGRISYELATNLSDDDAKRALQFGYQFEDGEANVYNDNPNCDGVGNSVVSVLPEIDNFGTNKCNKGRARRLLSVIDATSAKLQANMGYNALKKKKYSYVTESSTTQTTFFINCKIPLDIIHDYFKRVPLTKNSLYSLSLFLNAPCSVDCVVDGNQNDPTDAALIGTKVYGYAPVITTPNGFNPIQLSSLRVADGFGLLPDGEGHVYADLTLVTPKNAVTSFYGTSTPSNTCSLMVSVLQMSPSMEKAYLSNKVKEFTYEEVICQKINDVTNGKQINQIITNNLSRLRKIVLMPYYKGTANIPSAMLSPWDGFGAGFLSSPQCCISDFNVFVSGMPVFQKNLNTAQEFYEQFKSMTVNGGVSSAYLNSSLVDQAQYNSQYGAIVADLSRHDESEDGMAKSVTVQFTNDGERELNFLVYLYYEKSIKVDAELGNIIL